MPLAETLISADGAGPVMLFDGVCNLCNGAVQFMLRVEKHESLRFGTQQSSAAEAILKELNAPRDLSTVIYVQNRKVYTHSTAMAMLLRDHGKPFWALLGMLLSIVPRPIRDFGYRFIATNRYKWFGRKETCMVPTLELKKRFLPADD